MKIATRIHKDKNLREHVVEGVMNVLELKDTLEKYYRSDDYDPSLNSLWDLRTVDFREVKAEEVRALAEMVSRHWGGQSRSKAVLVVSHDLGFGLARMYEILLSGLESSNVMVCRSIEDGNRWLESAGETS